MCLLICLLVCSFTHFRPQVFCEWLERNGPFDVMIDGANVALWGENYEGGAFRPDKIRVMYDAVQKQSPDAKVLLVSDHSALSC